MRLGELFAELLVLQRQDVNGANQCRDVCFELCEFLVLVRDGLLQLGDLGAEPDLDVRGRAACFDVFVELVLQVGVALSEGVARDLRFLGERCRNGREAEYQALEASWRERALNREDALKIAHGEILRQREQIAELLGQIRDLNTGWTDDDRVRMTSENLALERTVRDQETRLRSVADKLAAARENNRFADCRIADLEARAVG